MSTARQIILLFATLATSLLSACGSSSGGGREVEASPPATSDIPGSPFSLVDAGRDVETSASASSNGTDAFDDEIDTLASLIVTGRDGDDTESFWSCRQSDAGDGRPGFPLRFWKNGFGYIGEQRMSWALAGAGELDIVVERGAVRLLGFEFATETRPSDVFTAVDTRGAMSVCRWEGPARGAAALEPQDDNDALVQFLGGDSGHDWSCGTTYRNGDVTTSGFTFLPSGRGTLDGADIGWYFDPDGNLFVHGTDELGMIHEFEITQQPGSPVGFAGEIEGARIECSRAT